MLEEKAAVAREEMVRFYPESTAQEWMEQHVSPVVGPLHRIIEEIGACVAEMVPPAVCEDLPAPASGTRP